MSNLPERYLLAEGGREVEYFFYPAQRADAPMLFILHGHDFAAVPAKFRNENYHVVCPMDRFGVQRGGSWWLGEDGDFFWLRVMPRIVESIRSRGGTDLFFWGSSMGGWGALLHGYLNHAKAVYANVPQTVLLDSSYSNEGGMKQYFSKIFGKDGGLSDFNDLKKIILDNRCRYFLCFNQLEKNNYFAEQGLIFLSHLNSIGAQTYFELRPLDSHGKNHGISETLGLFDKYC